MRDSAVRNSETESVYAAGVSGKVLSVMASILKILLGFTFVFSSLSKFISFDSFEIYVYSFGIFPMTLSFYVARLVLGFELVLGVALISHRLHRFTMLITMVFLEVFIVFLCYAYFIGRTDSCHCFGDVMPFDPVQSVIKNLVLMAVAYFVFKCSKTEWYPRWWLVLVFYLLMAVGWLLYVALSIPDVTPRILWEYPDLLTIVIQYHLKDFVIFGVLLIVGVLASFRFYHKWFVMAPLILLPMAAPFVLNPPDNWIIDDEIEEFDANFFESSFLEGFTPYLSGNNASDDFSVDNGRYVFALFSPTCHYCQWTAEKISTIVDRRSIDSDRVIYVFPIVKNKDAYDRFYEESRSYRFRMALIDSESFLRSTKSSFPKVVLVDNKKVVAVKGYRDTDEKTFRDFLTGK